MILIRARLDNSEIQHHPLGRAIKVNNLRFQTLEIGQQIFNERKLVLGLVHVGIWVSG